jgi:hypothetical protein
MFSWAGEVDGIEKTRNPHPIFEQKPTGKRQLGRSRKWEDNINK